MKNQLYTLFEEDQVLTANHLNELRRYLDQQDCVSRTQLIGPGILCGLEINNPDPYTIQMTGGVGVTSRGYLASIPDADYTHIRKYEDPGTIEPAPGETEAGVYPLFKDTEGNQLLLWELVDVKKEEAPAPDMHPINLGPTGTMVDEESGEKVHFSQFCVLLYLEMADEDLEDCFGDDCDEKGIRRNLNWRKLLIKKTDLENIIRSQREIGPETDLFEEVNACLNLDDLFIERPGYYYEPGISPDNGDNISDEQRSLSLKKYFRFQHLADDYRSIIEKASVRIGKALHKSYEIYQPLLADLYPANPFPGFDSNNSNENGLFKRVSDEIRFKPQVIQYAYDFLRDLVDAYNEFCEVACEVAAICRPDETPFPRHLMLNLAEPKEDQRRSPFRHYFQPSPILDGHQNIKRKMRYLHQRLVNMVRQFKVDTAEDDEVKITPGKPFTEPIGERAVPYYYNIDEAKTLLRLWNYQKTVRNKYLQISSYHADEYAGRSPLQTAMMSCDESSFLRVEGHVGRKYEHVLAEIKNLQERLNVPVKVIGVKLGKTFTNTELSYECRFDDLQELYETFKIELECLMEEEIQFFGSLQTQKKESEPEKKDDNGNDQHTGIFLAKGIGTSKFTAFSRGITEAANLFDTDFLASPQLLNISPVIWHFLFFKPAQIVQNIQNVQSLLEKRLMDLDVDMLESAYEQLIQTAKNYREQLTKSTENREVLEGKEQIIIFRLDKLIHGCNIRKIRELHRIYEDRKADVQKRNLFSNFAEKHIGLEHMAGVPKGGTFVLVYIDRNEEPIGSENQLPASVSLEEAGGLELSKVEKISRISGRTGIRERQLFSKKEKKEINQEFELLFKELQHISAEKNINIDAKKWAGLSKGIQDKINVLPEREIKDIPPDNVVVADFALPYLCRSDCPELATIVISQISISLSRTRFCKQDESSYPFNLHPEGGVIESSAEGVVKEGNTWFFKPSEASPTEEDVQFTYRVNNQTAVYNAKIFNPKADFDFVVETLDDGLAEVLFTNKSTGAQKYEWSFGDGNTSTSSDPVHRYVDFDEDIAVVSLKASKFECADEVIKQVDIPQEVVVEFRLREARLEDGVYLLCNNDEPYQFFTKPEGKPITGDNSGVITGDNKRYLAPRKYEPGSYKLDYQGETMDVKILPVGEVDFEIDYIERGTTFAQVKFINKSNGKVVQWMINNDEFSGEELERTLKNIGQPYKIGLTVKFENGCTNSIERFETIKFSEVPEEPDQPDSGSGVIDINVNKWMSELDNHKNDALDSNLFNGNNPLYNELREFFSSFQQKLQNPEAEKQYVNGGMNEDIGRVFKEMLFTSFEATISNVQEGSMQTAQYLLGYFKIQLIVFLYLVLGQTQDITENSVIGSVVVDTSKQLKKLLRIGLNIDPNGSFSDTIQKIQNTAKYQGKNNFLNMLE